MHEMAIIGNVVKVVSSEAEMAGATRVVSVTLRVGEIRDFHDEWVQRYFDFLSKGTPAEGASVKMVRSPLVFRCSECGADYGYDLHNRRMLIDGVPVAPTSGDGKPHCPDHPQAAVHMVSGNEILIENLEVV